MTARIPRGILKHSDKIQRTFAVDYRLCSSAPFPAANPFPTALIDSLSGYKYLLDLGFKAENIIFAGDSAGGNLCLAMARYISRTPQAGLPMPGAFLLISPWTDIASTLVGSESSRALNKYNDIFKPRSPRQERGVGDYGAISYHGHGFTWDDLETNPYFSPGSTKAKDVDGSFKDLPKTYILAGGAEVILDDSKVIAEKIIADKPTPGWVTLDIVPDEVHDFVIWPWCEPNPTDAFKRIGNWIGSL